jgi:hypothetical protein
LHLLCEGIYLFIDNSDLISELLLLPFNLLLFRLLVMFFLLLFLNCLALRSLLLFRLLFFLFLPSPLFFLLL